MAYGFVLGSLMSILVTASFLSLFPGDMSTSTRSEVAVFFGVLLGILGAVMGALVVRLKEKVQKLEEKRIAFHRFEVFLERFDVLRETSLCVERKLQSAAYECSRSETQLHLLEKTGLEGLGIESDDFERIHTKLTTECRDTERYFYALYDMANGQREVVLRERNFKVYAPPKEERPDPA